MSHFLKDGAQKIVIYILFFSKKLISFIKIKIKKIPFKSEAQRKFLFSKFPKMVPEFVKNPKEKNLPKEKKLSKKINNVNNVNSKK